MKKIIRSIGKFFQILGSFFDKWLITPITKFILKIMEVLKNNSKNIDRVAGKKSTLITVSLILAFGVFFIIDKESSIMIDKYAEILYNQPVTAVYNEELYVVEGLPKTVDITLVGQRRHIFLAKQSPSKGVSVDLTGLKPGNHKVTLKYSQRLKSLDYKLNPSQVTVTIHEKVSDTKNLTVDILHKDNLDKKLYIENVELDRTEVIVKGAAYKLKKVATVKALVDVNDINNPKAGEMTLKDVPLVAYDTNGKVVDVEVVPKKVDAKLTITSPSKEVPIKVIPTGQIAFGWAISSISTSETKVTIYGNKETLQNTEYIPVLVDVSNLQENKNYKVEIEKPSGIKAVSIDSINVSIAVTDKIKEKNLDVNIDVHNLSDKYVVQGATKDDIVVTVNVKGAPTVIEGLTAADINAYIDLKDYTEGTYEVEVNVSGTDPKISYTVKTKKVKIKISKK